MGTAQFAVPALKKLLASRHEVMGVVTQPDRPSGRGREVRISPIKQGALEAGIPVHQPEKVRSEEFIALVREMSPDAIVVAAFGQIIPKAILDIPRFGGVNVHGSLLPKYRGAAPVHYALFKGETVTGVTTMLMDPGLDTGPILLKQEVEISPDDDQAALEARLAEVGADLLIETLELLEKGAIVPTPQDDSLATHAPSVKREECLVDWNQDAQAIVNRVRGCTPRPGAYAFYKGSMLRIWSAKATDEASGNPGEVMEVGREGILVGAGRGAALLTEVQPENRKRMKAGDFARGYGVTVGTELS